jgi:hypothetical protein
VIFYATVGFAALLPSMRGLSEPAPQHGAETGPQRIIWMACAALIAPAVLYIEYANGTRTEIDLGGVVDAPVVAGAAALMFLLVLLRVNGLAMAQRRAGARERALREAGASLFAAATERDVVRAVQRAVATLMPADRPYRLGLTGRATGVPHEAAIRLITADRLPASAPARAGCTPPTSPSPAPTAGSSRSTAWPATCATTRPCAAWS